MRQWSILRDIESAADLTIASLASRYGVCQRTIRRDLDALQAAGFPLYPERSESGANCWRLSGKPFRKLSETSFTLSELCALYATRSRLGASGASPIDADLKSALTKIVRSLSPHMKAYLDKLAAVVTYRRPPGGLGVQSVLVDSLAGATVDRRRVEMDYHSFASKKIKRYEVEPHRLVFTNGGLYLYAFVPGYAQMRTFALQRIKRLKVLEAPFTPVEVDSEPYRHSLGPFSGGRTECVEIEFTSSVAPYVAEREWHESQAVTRLDDGSIVLRMEVAVDFSLRAWILGFGHQARVLRPSRLAADILEEIEEAREQYAPRIPFEASVQSFAESARTHLLFEPRGSTASRRSSPRRPSINRLS